MENQLSNVELDLLFVSASSKHSGDYKEEYWQKLEERLNMLENCLNNESMPSSQIEKQQFLGVFKLKCKLFKK